MKSITHFSKYHSYPRNPIFSPPNSISQSRYLSDLLCPIRNFFTVCLGKQKLETPFLQGKTPLESHEHWVKSKLYLLCDLRKSYNHLESQISVCKMGQMIPTFPGCCKD